LVPETSIKYPVDEGAKDDRNACPHTTEIRYGLGKVEGLNIVLSHESFTEYVHFIIYDMDLSALIKEEIV